YAFLSICRYSYLIQLGYSDGICFSFLMQRCGSSIDDNLPRRYQVELFEQTVYVLNSTIGTFELAVYEDSYTPYQTQMFDQFLVACEFIYVRIWAVARNFKCGVT